MPKWYHENAEGGTRNAEQGARGPCACSAFRVPTSAFGRSRPYRTNTLPDPLFPSLDAVTSANPAPTARTSTVWPNAPSIRATEESLTVHDTARPERMFPLASRRVAKKLALSPAATVSADGVTSTVATESPGGGGGGNESTTSSAVPLFPWLLAVTVVLPRRRARRMTDCPNSPSMRATVGSATLHLTLASLAGFPVASRRSAKNPALSPTATVADSGETVTDATGPGLGPGIESPEESTAATSPSGRPAPSCSLQAATASAVAASAAVRTPFMRFLRECVQTGYPALLVPGHIGPPPVHGHSRSDLPFTLRIPHAAAAWRAAHRDRGGDGSRRRHAGAAGGAARPLSRPARRVGAAARGDAAHRRELALGARPHGACRGGDARQLGRCGDLGAAPGRGDGHLGRRPRHVSADRGGGAAAHPGRRQGAHPLQRGCARDRRDRNRARAPLSRPRSRATPARLRRRNAAGAPGRPAHGLGARACRDPVHRDCRRRRGLVDAPGAGGPRDRRRRPHRGERRLRQQDRNVPAGRARAASRRAVLLRRALHDHRWGARRRGRNTDRAAQPGRGKDDRGAARRAGDRCRAQSRLRRHAGALRDRVRDRPWPREAAVRGWKRGEPPPVRGALVAVVGGGTCTPQEAAWAAAVGRLLAERGAVLLCGGLGGVMSAAARGAKQAGGLTGGILPGNDPRESNPDIDVSLATGMGEMCYYI